MPVTTRADGDVITASSWNANVRDQVISTVTSGTRPSGTEGQFIYETDTDLVYVYSGSAWVRMGSHTAGTSWTPTVTQGVAITKTISVGTYFKFGRMVTLFANLSFTSAGSGANVVITITNLPFSQAHSSGLHGGGHAIFYDASATTVYPYAPVVADTTTIKFQQTDAAHTVGLYLGLSGSTFGGAIASGDNLHFVHTYEATS